MNHTLIILAGTAATLSVLVWGIVVFADGLAQRRLLASRSVLEEVERRANHPMARLDVVLRRTDLGKAVERRLARSGVRVKVSTFLLSLTVACVLAIVFVWQILAPLLGLLSAGLVGFLFYAYLRRQEERRREAFTAQLPELARVLSNATSAGLALPTAIDMAADELDDPAGSELRRAAESIKLGQSFEAAIEEMRRRMPSREIGVLISTLLVSARSGGALVTALRNISETLESRKETRREVKTILGETTSTAWALLAMGIGSLFLLNLTMPGTVARMTESPAGLIILCVSLSLFTTGFVLIRRMARIDF
ncbi:type II secretion system F family protein [Marinactinospora thermotolerans]|uniref:Tight adherence protein B n=1 Tax=Marinactinospora thermotolerans DSM 45154 TaxID=1122192 RepID=A0A1T4RP73_9ACTN|nr:type II secretion system F family protein [Marinactinospora thermotolerans]SKA17743.1 tight adherence protein B [Marinactinospora thermotolerans DSM 45154]